MPPKASSSNATQAILSAADLMPKQKEATRILHERANYLAIHETDTKEKKGFISYIKFRLGANESYGVPYHYTKEVMQHMTPIKVPFLPDFIAGVINHRGALLAVFDLKKLFHIQSSVVNQAYVILITNQHMTVGILADSIDGSDAYDPTALDAALLSEDIIKPEYIVGLHQGLTAIINVDAILSDPQLKK